ncbi:hypothetical protein OSTOST_01808 [Ostertagia ostertagi]
MTEKFTSDFLGNRTNSISQATTLALSRLHQLYKTKETNSCWNDYCKIIEEQLEKQFTKGAPHPTTKSEVCQQPDAYLYVDNVLVTDTNTQSLIEKYKTCKQIFNGMSMNLRQFIANDKECNSLIKSEDLPTSKLIKILGIPWNPVKDNFSITCKLHCTANPTKRMVLQAVHSTFDPLGFLPPLLLNAKHFLQD